MHTTVRRLLAALFVAGCVVAASAGAAAADGGMADGWVNGDSGDIGAEAGAEGREPDNAVGGDGSSGEPPACTYTALDGEMSDIADQLARNSWGSPGGTGPGTWYRKVCTDGTGTIVWIPDGAPVDPAALARQAFDRTNVPLPGVHFNPSPPQDLFVNMEAWLWVDNFAPVGATASAGPVTVSVTASPSTVRWSMGNGDEVVCPGAGVAYDPGRPPEEQRTDCSYTYRHSSAAAPDGRFTVRTTVTWNVTWTATGIAAGGELGQLSRTTVTEVRVAEVQAVHQ